jgi:hypothetical protein
MLSPIFAFSACKSRTRASLRRVLHIPLHFEARQQLDIARDIVRAGFPVALGFLTGIELCPLGLKRVARLCLIDRAPLLRLLVPPSNWHSLAISNFGTVSAIGTACREVRITIGRWASILFSGLRDLIQSPFANVVGRIGEGNRSIMGEAGHVGVTFGARMPHRTART